MASSPNEGPKSRRGFASMKDRDPQKQRAIASSGGKTAHAKGTAHEYDSSEAREAGRKGGMAVSRNREHMAAIGRRGGEARANIRATAEAAAASSALKAANDGNTDTAQQRTVDDADDDPSDPNDAGHHLLAFNIGVHRPFNSVSADISRSMI